MTAIQLSHFTAVSALGYGIQSHVEALLAEKNALRQCDYSTAQLNTWIGRVPLLENHQMPHGFSDWYSRNNVLAYAALQQDNMQEKILASKQKYGEKRIGLLLGTTTSGFAEAERAYQACDTQGKLPDAYQHNKTANPFATVAFLREYLGLAGPAMTIATACSSSAKAFIMAHHWLALDLCDAVLIAGIDSLCLNILYGFNSLGILSSDICRPFDAQRAGLSLGEAAALLLVERPQSDKENRIGMLGYGESSDGYHLSAPHPEGKGAILAMRQALTMAQLLPQQIDYINFHGTASQQNDRVEDHAVYALFSDQVPASSSKGWMGHTLGAAGALEVIITVLAIQQNILLGTLNTTAVDPQFKSKILLRNQPGAIQRALVNSFGFGGNNCSLIIGELGHD